MPSTPAQLLHHTHIHTHPLPHIACHWFKSNQLCLFFDTEPLIRERRAGRGWSCLKVWHNQKWRWCLWVLSLSCAVHTNTHTHILHMWQAWCCLNLLDSLLLGVHSQVKGGNISSYQLSTTCIKRERPCDANQHVVHCSGTWSRSETMNSTPPVMCDY